MQRLHVLARSSLSEKRDVVSAGLEVVQVLGAGDHAVPANELVLLHGTAFVRREER